MKKVGLLISIIFIACYMAGCAGSKCGMKGSGAATGITYIVEKGDTLYKISRKFNIPVNEIAEANSIMDKDIIKEGTVLAIPE